MENETESQENSLLPAMQLQTDPIKALLNRPTEEKPNADGLSAMLQSPELLAKLPQVMALLKPMLGETSAPVPAKPATREEERDRLLLSLRPFLSKERQEMLESVLKLSKLGEVLKQFS